jgi:hypothetical protein
MEITALAQQQATMRYFMLKLLSFRQRQFDRQCRKHTASDPIHHHFGFRALIKPVAEFASQ